ncbi:MAG: hypothetical protein NWS47_00215, partial [Alphaproteobacteria bacterium]|nr:hypothetical protein [Alphaproteobacteria bacterium]
MKKFLNTMLITAAVVAASTGVYAASAGKVAQGAYVGASAGAANTNVKYDMVSSNPTNITAGTAADALKNVNTNAGKTAGIVGLLGGNNFQSGSLVFGTAADELKNVNTNAGKTAGIFGLLGGYNFQSGSLVFGGEIYGGVDSTKVTVLNDSGSGKSVEASTSGELTVKRSSFIGFAPRLGFMVAPNTLMYARLGMEAGKWKATLAPNQKMIDLSTTTAAQKSDSRQTVSASKGGMSFAPGLG